MSPEYTITYHLKPFASDEHGFWYPGVESWTEYPTVGAANHERYIYQIRCANLKTALILAERFCEIEGEIKKRSVQAALA